jgi:hypothetical protein
MLKASLALVVWRGWLVENVVSSLEVFACRGADCDILHVQTSWWLTARNSFEN